MYTKLLPSFHEIYRMIKALCFDLILNLKCVNVVCAVSGSEQHIQIRDQLFLSLCVCKERARERAVSFSPPSPASRCNCVASIRFISVNFLLMVPNLTIVLNNLHIQFVHQPPCLPYLITHAHWTDITVHTLVHLLHLVLRVNQVHDVLLNKRFTIN